MNPIPNTNLSLTHNTITKPSPNPDVTSENPPIRFLPEPSVRFLDDSSF